MEWVESLRDLTWAWWAAFAIVWVISGVVSLAWDWTQALPLRVSDLPTVLLCGAIIGPVLAMGELFVWLVAFPFRLIGLRKVLIKARVN